MALDYFFVRRPNFESLICAWPDYSEETYEVLPNDAAKKQSVEKPTSKVPDSYTAIIYFHGMGSPRRHEEISRLTDGLDQFSSSLDDGSVGRLREQKVLFEPSRVEEDDDVAFVQVTRVVKRFGRSAGKSHFRREALIRIYEGYWAPYAAGGSSWLRVLVWLLSRFTNPLRVLSQTWRAHQRLKLATLYRMYAENTDASLEKVYRQLESFYIAYENWPARRDSPSGDFAGFLSQISGKLSSPAQQLKTLALAKNWKQRFRREQFALLFSIATVIAGAVNALLFLMYFSVSLVRFVFPDFLTNVHFFDDFPPVPYPHFFLLAVALTLVFYLIKAKRYLSTFWADVMFWTTQEEKSAAFAKRKDILRAATQILAHVLRDERCTRIVVVGYSLGSAIAYESLLKLGRRKTARETTATDLPIELTRLNIISHLVTIGSPIDWIHYFFELHESRFHRYNRIRDILKGNTDDPPFTINALLAPHG